ncbi:hypothetical protein [Autumnicola psychrophila]|uniref:Uncharacterized protein n=1 Tax=Autumnicola psychrophila TaxID=3075592 RepID=A0ABU3DQZ0_9FLAO|nr:hypothetical protein [Zunongwangia sp. F225]MDT0686023.1 hypothetical protein [Zunongwangia sp. F225]
MELVKEKKSFTQKQQPIMDLHVTQEMLKGLCFNCDNRRSCVWKENRKLYCEHFE